jgi:excisionase family DNA binding protein
MVTTFLRATEIANILKISKALAYRLIAEGEISSIRFGRTIRVRLEDLEIFIQRNMTNPLVQIGDEKDKSSNLETARCSQ